MWISALYLGIPLICLHISVGSRCYSRSTDWSELQWAYDFPITTTSGHLNHLISLCELRWILRSSEEILLLVLTGMSGCKKGLFQLLFPWCRMPSLERSGRYLHVLPVRVNTSFLKTGFKQFNWTLLFLWSVFKNVFKLTRLLNILHY